MCSFFPLYTIFDKLFIYISMTQKVQMVALNRKFFQVGLRYHPAHFSAAKIPSFRPQIFRHSQNMFRLTEKYDEWDVI